MRLRGGIWLVVLLAGLSVAPASHASAPLPYGTNDGGGFYNILPPGSNGLLNSTELASHVALGQRPKHSQDQLRMYENLVYATPGLTQARITDFFKDATFGVQAGDVESTVTPRPGVTIIRDKGFGVPRVYGTTRADTMFGAGYANAQDRLFFMDVLRNAGRSKLSSFAGGANKGMDEGTWSLAPYRETDFQRQYDDFDDLYGAEGSKIQSDVQAYADGINAYIGASKLNPLLLPGEYVALGKPGGPTPWKVTDIVATATLVGSIFGKGGGGELRNALAYQSAVRRFGTKRGKQVFKDMRSDEDAEAPVTVRGKTFTSMPTPKKAAKGTVALPDRGSVVNYPLTIGATGGARSAARANAQSAVQGVIGSLKSLPRSMSNALLVSGRKSASGHPLAVFGPQTGYFNPQILWEVELHGPGIDARGAAFNGVGLYVTLGRGRDYAWSATSASQDIIDTFSVPLCEPGGGKPTKASNHYIYKGSCIPFDRLENHNYFQPNLADGTPAGGFTLQALRSKFGLVQARALVKGRPVAYTRLRSTYMHEADAAIGISRFNDPNAMRNPQDFQRAAYRIPYTFHWFYADSKHIAYLNSGDDPVRAKGIDPNFPVASSHAWRGLDPDGYRASYTSISKHPQTIDQDWIVNWNNKGARGYRAADLNWEYTSLYRSNLLQDQVTKRLRGGRKMTLPNLIDAMEVAGSSDLRAVKVVPYLLRVLGTPKDARLRDATGKLRAWVAAGGLRRDQNRDGTYEHLEAIRILDAWWPRMVKGALEPALGADFYSRAIGAKNLDNDPNNHGAHLGSAYQGGTYGLLHKDLRTLLGNERLRKSKLKTLAKRNRYSRTYCGAAKGRKATLGRCRSVLANTLGAALGDSLEKLYGHDNICGKQPGLGPADPRRGKGPNVFCWDAIWFRGLGAAEQPVIHWINRPTFQQAVEIEHGVGR